jgi:hypothetical protein
MTSYRGLGTRPSSAVLIASLLGLTLAAPAAAPACPFCTTLSPTLSQQRESATIVALVEPIREPEAEKARADGPAAAAGRHVVRLHRLLKSPPQFQAGTTLALPADVALPSAGLVLVFGTRSAADSPSTPSDDKDAPAKPSSLDRWSWTLVPVSEIDYAYAARAPELRTPTTERLHYFARYLEHSDPLIANDAYLEFGHAAYDEVAKVADQLPMDRLRAWVADEQVPQQRKGFYGLALGLAREPAERQRNREALERLIATPAEEARAGSDFRSGFDGLLGGYLMLAGREGLDQLVARYFANPAAPVGDLRHALTALRFYHEYGREIPLKNQRAALRQALDRPPLADQVIIDLARWADWDALSAVAALYNAPAYENAGTRRAIIGYLLACPRPEARQELGRLRSIDPHGVAAAEQVLRDFSGANPANGSAGAR